MDYKRLGERIREERLRLHLTQAQLAEAVDISDTYMGAIERGERSLTLDTLVRLVNRDCGLSAGRFRIRQRFQYHGAVQADHRQPTDGA